MGFQDNHVSAACARHVMSCPLQVIEASDVILEILDARDPMGCRCPQLEEAVLKHKGNKRLLLVLNKTGE